MRIAVVGCGLIGSRRARVAAAAGDTVAYAVDLLPERAAALAAEVGGAPLGDWQEVLRDSAVEAVCVATVNASLMPVTVAALEAGKHVLCEKPLGRNALEATAMAEAAQRAGRLLRVGFNLRYHPGLAEAHALVEGGAIGRVAHLRAAYGHGGRPGYEAEWRGNAELAGGGELLDQGVHLVDLCRWFLGPIARVQALMRTVAWPIAPLEDNGFALLEATSGAVAVLHTSWTQWRNLFRFEVFGDRGAVTVEGLGGSYGPESLTIHTRRLPEGGRPDEQVVTYGDEDVSWSAEWRAFRRAVESGEAEMGTPADGVGAARVIDAMYASARAGGPVSVIPDA